MRKHLYLPRPRAVLYPGRYGHSRRYPPKKWMHFGTLGSWTGPSFGFPFVQNWRSSSGTCVVSIFSDWPFHLSWCETNKPEYCGQNGLQNWNWVSGFLFKVMCFCFYCTAFLEKPPFVGVLESLTLVWLYCTDTLLTSNMLLVTMITVKWRENVAGEKFLRKQFFYSCIWKCILELNFLVQPQRAIGTTLECFMNIYESWSDMMNVYC